VLSVIGGLGLFLYGMKIMSDSMENVAGTRFRKIFEDMNNHPIRAMLIGLLITCIIQSSSATTVMVVGFVSAGLLPLTTAAYIIIGANVGTTITAQLIAFNIPMLHFELADIAPVILIIGIIMMMVSKRRNINLISEAMVGFGLLFIGITLMGSALNPLRDVPELKDWIMYVADNPILGLLLGTSATGVIQSSSAFTGILQALAKSTDAMTLRGCVYMIIGSNIGTCVTAMLASAGTNRMARRASWFHLLFNTIGAIIFMVILAFFSTPIITFIESMTPNDIAWQIANTHTFFNLLTAIIFMFIAPFIVKFTYFFVPGEDKMPEPLKLLYIDEHTFNSHLLIVPSLIKEVNRMAELAIGNLRLAVDTISEAKAPDADKIKEVEEVVNFLNHSITKYLVIANKKGLTDEDGEIVNSLFHVINDIERIGDHAENICEYAQIVYSKKISFSQEGSSSLNLLKEKVYKILNDSMEAFNTRNLELLGDIEKQEEDIDYLEENATEGHMKRLNLGLCTPENGLIYTSVLSNLERVGDHAINIAYSIEKTR